MPIYCIRFEHYGPKDSESGVYALLDAKDDEAVLGWLIQKDLVDFDADDYAEYSTHDVELLERAEQFEDIAVLDTNTCCGPMRSMWLWLRGTPYEPEDTYYGCTHYSWELLCTGKNELAAAMKAAGLLKVR